MDDLLGGLIGRSSRSGLEESGASSAYPLSSSLTPVVVSNILPAT